MDLIPEAHSQYFYKEKYKTETKTLKIKFKYSKSPEFYLQEVLSIAHMSLLVNVLVLNRFLAWTKTKIKFSVCFFLGIRHIWRKAGKSHEFRLNLKVASKGVSARLAKLALHTKSLMYLEMQMPVGLLMSVERLLAGKITDKNCFAIYECEHLPLAIWQVMCLRITPCV